MSFSRPLTPASSEQDIDLASGCHYFIYPVGGGEFTAGTYRKHGGTPRISAQALCMDTCNGMYIDLLLA